MAGSDIADGREWVELLATVEPFADLSRVTLAKLAGSFETFTVAAGSIVMQQGDVPDGFYVITRGRFGVWASLRASSAEIHLGTLATGDFFGEMSLLSDAPREATIRAIEDGIVVRLEPARFHELLRREPTVAQAIAVSLVQRIRQLNRTVLERSFASRDALGEHLARLNPERRIRVLQASILGTDIAPESLAALFGAQAEQTRADLEPFIEDPAAAPQLLKILRDVFTAEAGAEGVAAYARQAARALARHELVLLALRLAADYGPRSLFLELLADALRRAPGLPTDQISPWVQMLTDEECLTDADLALAMAEQYEQQGEHAGAAQLLRQAQAAALARHDQAGAERLGVKSTSVEASNQLANISQALALTDQPQAPIPAIRSGPRRRRRGPIIQAMLALGLLGGAVLVHAQPQWTFSLLLAAALILWSGELMPNFAVALALVAAWVLLGVTDATRALSGFASLNWIFVLALLALADSVARSGLLFRLGLLLTQHMPSSFVGKASILMAGGALLAPLLPQNQARAALTTPLALAVVDGERLSDRGPAATVLGLATWIGSGPLMFLFLNGSPLCLLAWAMLPDASRARFDWVGWLVAAVPFGLLSAVGSLIMLFVLFRPLGESRRAPERLTMQMAILGPISERERRTIWIMGLTVLGFVLGPMVGMDIRIVAPITLVLAVLLGIFDKQGLRELDWGYMLFLGVVLTVPNVLVGVGLDKPIASAILGILGEIGGGPIIFLLVTATITVLTRLVMDQYQGIVLFCTTLMPAAASLGIDPWLVAITVLATSAMWFVPNQTNSYLMAYAGSEGRLFTHRAARTACFWYLIVVLGSIVLSVPYWQYLGLL